MQRAPNKREYGFYKDGYLECTGTIDNIAKQMGLTERTIKCYSSNSYQKTYKSRYRVQPITYFKRYMVDTDRLIERAKELDYTKAALCEAISITHCSLSKRLKKGWFYEEEIEIFEDLLFLDEGELKISESFDSLPLHKQEAIK